MKIHDFLGRAWLTKSSALTIGSVALTIRSVLLTIRSVALTDHSVKETDLIVIPLSKQQISCQPSTTKKNHDFHVFF